MNSMKDRHVDVSFGSRIMRLPKRKGMAKVEEFIARHKNCFNFILAHPLSEWEKHENK
jgi:hypothetical protein